MVVQLGPLGPLLGGGQVGQEGGQAGAACVLILLVKVDDGRGVKLLLIFVTVLSLIRQPHLLADHVNGIVVHDEVDAGQEGDVGLGQVGAIAVVDQGDGRAGGGLVDGGHGEDVLSGREERSVRTPVLPSIQFDSVFGSTFSVRLLNRPAAGAAGAAAAAAAAGAAAAAAEAMLLLLGLLLHVEEGAEDKICCC